MPLSEAAATPGVPVNTSSHRLNRLLDPDGRAVGFVPVDLWA
ncbi:hypothetical protein [Streptomyces sp. NPDC058382]